MFSLFASATSVALHLRKGFLKSLSKRLVWKKVFLSILVEPPLTTKARLQTIDLWSTLVAGVILSTREPRGFRQTDFDQFDYIVTMDEKNYENISNLDSDGRYSNKVHRMVSFCQKVQVPEVPDPYYEGPDGFEIVLDILEDGCTNLLNEIKKGLENPNS